MSREECILLSYNDKNENLSAKGHCDMYLNIKKDIVAIATHYPIDFTVAGTEIINNLQQEKEQLIKYLEEMIKELEDDKEYVLKVIGENGAWEDGFKSAYEENLQRICSICRN